MNRPHHPADVVADLRAHSAALWVIAGDHAKLPIEPPLSYTDCVAEGRDMFIDPGMEQDLDNWAEAAMDRRAELR